MHRHCENITLLAGFGPECQWNSWQAPTKRKLTDVGAKEPAPRGRGRTPLKRRHKTTKANVHQGKSLEPKWQRNAALGLIIRNRRRRVSELGYLFLGSETHACAPCIGLSDVLNLVPANTTKTSIQIYTYTYIVLCFLQHKYQNQDVQRPKICHGQQFCLR